MIFIIPFVIFALVVLGGVVITQWETVSTYAALFLAFGALGMLAFGTLWSIAAFGHWQRRKEIDLKYREEEKRVELHNKLYRFIPDPLGNLPHYHNFNTGSTYAPSPGNQPFAPYHYVQPGGKVTEAKPDRSVPNVIVQVQPRSRIAAGQPSNVYYSDGIQPPAPVKNLPQEATIRELEGTPEPHLLESATPDRTLEFEANTPAHQSHRTPTDEEIIALLADDKRKGRGQVASIKSRTGAGKGGKNPTYDKWADRWRELPGPND